MAEISLNNSWRVVVAAIGLISNSAMFFWATIYGNPANALHSWAQSACLISAMAILGCLAGFAAVATLTTTLTKK